MPLSYDVVQIPTQVKLLNDFFSGPPDALSAAYEFALRLLGTGDPLPATTEKLAGPDREIFPEGLTEDDARHFQDHWLDSAKGKHPWSRPEVGEIMRDAYRDAVTTANAKNPKVPIITAWVFVNSTNEFSMHVIDGDHHVSVFALIPQTWEIRFDEPRPDSHRRFS